MFLPHLSIFAILYASVAFLLAFSQCLPVAASHKMHKFHFIRALLFQQIAHTSAVSGDLLAILVQFFAYFANERVPLMVVIHKLDEGFLHSFIGKFCYFNISLSRI